MQSKPQRIPPDFETFWQIVGWYSDVYDVDGLSQHLHKMFDQNERQLNPSRRKLALSAGHKQRAGFDMTTKHKLKHDLEQFEYLAENQKIRMNVQTRKLFETELPLLYNKVLERMEATDYDEETEYYPFTDADTEIVQWYNRALFLPEMVDDKSKQPIPLLNPEVDFAKTERQWFGEEPGYEHPGIVVIDNLLSPAALDKVRDYLLMSTFWYEAKTPRYGRYVGAYIADGMHDKLLMAIAYELHKAMPRVMKGHPMKEMWSYKYESAFESGSDSQEGIHTHADDAAVNVNIWLTPDSANLDPMSGGLVVYTAKPPKHWGFSEFNSNWEFVEENLLKPTGFANVTVPYRQNRAVIFDSFLFHKTDQYKFSKGYENRRINLTILYGDRQSSIGKEEL